MMNKGLTRRKFLIGAAVFAAGCATERTHKKNARLRSPNEILNVAGVGVGGKGDSDLSDTAAGRNVRVAAICDVDARNLAHAAKKYPDARTFRDYRRMLDELGGDIDAVLVSTPDHMHAPIALAAMSLGKHVHVQKPLAHNLEELRAMALMAEEQGVVTQMGTQIHSHSAYRTGVAMIRQGAIGKAREACLWVGSNWGRAEGRPDKSDPVPDYLDWDLWLGVAPERPFVNGIYHPAEWRRWKDFGIGTLGDMGCHIFDPVFSALDLNPPVSAVSSGPQPFEETYALETEIAYTFAGTDYAADGFTLRWLDGERVKNADPAKAQLPPGVALPGGGSYIVGEKGVMVLPHWSLPSFYCGGQKMDIEMKALEDRNHYTEFTDACRGEGQTSTPFSYSTKVAESVLIGTVAARFPGEKLEWNSRKLRFDKKEANELVRRKHRSGWRMEGLLEIVD
ncbi:MAG TPA: Gfo/Idh/MocA family oxidoreductase [Candidatus Brocadiia bacterium]|nr:Gfo/Idh/MocA family oxidoreductase [Candidatus Brocadiia bacterium]